MKLVAEKMCATHINKDEKFLHENQKSKWIWLERLLAGTNPILTIYL